MVIRNVAIIGANGTLGPAILEALLSADAFNVTVLSRASSRSTFPSKVDLIKIPDDGGDGNTLTKLLSEQDALVVTIPASESSYITELAKASAQAGVQRFIPPDFGSVDSTDERCLSLVPLYRQKGLVREHLQKLAVDYTSFSWTSLDGLLQFNLQEKTAQIVDDGNTRWSTSTLPRIGEEVVRILQKPDITKNKMLYMQSFYVSQNRVLDALNRAIGQSFTISHIDSKDALDNWMKRREQGDPDALEGIISILGMTRSNWDSDSANGLLELPRDSLDDVVQRVSLSVAGEA